MTRTIRPQKLSATGTAGEISDPRTMRALSHPLRWALIDLLASEPDSTATATRCAVLTSESQASCSFHLRQLARYGFVEQAPSESKRDRPWRLVKLEQSWGGADQPDEAHSRAAARLSAVFADREHSKLQRWIAGARSYPRSWQRAAIMSGVTATLTVTELADVQRRVAEVLAPYIDRATLPNQLQPRTGRPVRLFVAGYPLPRD
ncbi:MAG: ArsR/SmtB family transcription factor [Nakamurella sp.]